MTKLQRLQTAKDYYPNAQIELTANSDFQLLIAVVLSAQTTDVAVNKVTPQLFEAFADAKALKEAEYEEVYPLINKLGLAKQKSKNIIKAAKIYDEDFKNIMPRTIEELTKMPGVGNKTASVCLANVYDLPFMAVDTHVWRISKRLSIVGEDANVDQVARELEKILPKKDILQYHHSLIFFGRYMCLARNPKCDKCLLQDDCNFNK